MCPEMGHCGSLLGESSTGWVGVATRNAPVTIGSQALSYQRTPGSRLGYRDGEVNDAGLDWKPVKMDEGEVHVPTRAWLG